MSSTRSDQPSDGANAFSGIRAEHPSGGPKAAAISNHVVKVVNEYTGRGPTKSRAFITDAVVVVLLEDTMTKGERSLVRDGKSELVLNTRKEFQHTMREALIAGIEQILGRKVTAFMSDNHLDPDVGAELFVLAPESG